MAPNTGKVTRNAQPMESLNSSARWFKGGVQRHQFSGLMLADIVTAPGGISKTTIWGKLILHN